MKKIFLCCFILLIVCFSGCKKIEETPIVTTTVETITTEETSEKITTTETEVSTTTTHSTIDSTETEISHLPLSDETMEFSFLSGAGAWRTVITLNKDGTFDGLYHDSEMGITGEGYPNGSAYVCEFSGRFTDIKKINDYSYKMTLSDVKTTEPIGKEWIEDGIFYTATGPHGLMNSQESPDFDKVATEFIFYLPDAPVDSLPDDFLEWWPYRYEHSQKPFKELSCYGILNIDARHGFFTYNNVDIQ